MRIGANIEARSILLEEIPAGQLHPVCITYALPGMPPHDADLISIGWNDDEDHVEIRDGEEATHPETGETFTRHVPQHVQRGRGIIRRRRADGEFAEVFLDRSLIIPFEQAWRAAHAEALRTAREEHVRRTTAPMSAGPTVVQILPPPGYKG